MKRLYLTSLTLILFTSAFAQDLIHSRRSSYYTFIYKITNDQAKSLYKDMWNLDNTYLTNLFDSFPTDSVYKKNLPVGHYVFVKTENTDLKCELQSVNNLNMNLLNNHRDLVMVFNDSLGNEVHDARVRVRSRNVPFDDDVRAFRLGKTNKKGIVSAEYNGHVSYFEIGRRQNNTFFIRTAKGISRTFPINHLLSPFFYIYENVRNISYGGGVTPPGIYHRVARIFKPKPHTGYIAFNKPMYRPDDTVRLKGVLTKRKGKPVDKTIDIYLEKYYPDEYRKKIGTVSPFRKGAYQFEFALVDSLKLKLDNNYEVYFYDKKGNRLLSSSFQFEDYELKQNTYSVRSEKPSPQKPAVLYLRGEDSNAMPLFDVRAEIVLKPRTVQKYYEQQVFVPDTLWFYRTRLDAAGETKINIPDSVMPPVSLKYEAVVSFFNTENERTVKTLQLDHDTKPFPINIEVVNDSVKVTNLDPENPVTSTATLTWWTSDDDFVDKDIMIPYAEKINRFADSYAVSYSVDGEVTWNHIEMGEFDDQLAILAERTTDSLLVATENPRKLPFRYFLFKNRNLVERGETESLSFKRRVKASDAYALSVQYVWAGRAETREYEIGFNKKNLDITVDHPAIIYPGQTARFKISVKDAFGDPVGNVDLTAYAITKKFEGSWAPAVPSFAKRSPQRAIFNEFATRESDTSVGKIIDWAYWRKALGLDSIAFYHFLFPDSGYYEHRFEAETTQFAPFVVSNGDVRPVQVIYVDGQPVYYEGVSTVEPYSFHISPGDHTIDLRTSNKQFTIRNVRVDSGQKLIFSIDAFHLPDNCSALKMPFRFSDDELKRLGRYFMVLRSPSKLQDAHLSQGNIYRLLDHDRNAYGYSPRERLIGPFYPGALTYTEKDGLKRTFEYQPFTAYEFGQQFLKLHRTDMTNYMDDMFSWYSEIPPFDQNVQTLRAIEEYWQKVDETAAFTFQRFPDFEPASPYIGRLTLDGSPEETKDLLPRAIFVIDLNNPDNYSIFSTRVSDAPLIPGVYQVALIFSDGQYVRADSLEVKPYGNNYYDLKSLAMHDADTFSIHIMNTIRKWSKEANYVTQERKHELQRAQQYLYQQSSASYHFGHDVTGRVIASDDGSGIPGVSVVIKGTALGTVTDMDGYYRISCPPNGTLVFSFIGFATEEASVSSRPSVDVTLEPDVQQLSEVVVVGLGVQTKRSLTAGVSTHLAGKVAGVQIRGLSTISPDANPLVILDGRVVSLDDIDRDKITAITVLKDAEATALFGSRAADGVILLSTQPGATKEDLIRFSQSAIGVAALEATPGNALRTNFRDYAFWKPALITDAEGQASFEATFPDDITGWNAHVLAMGSKRRTGRGTSAIRSYKPLLAQIAQPHFLIEGDSSNAIGKITNYSQEQVTLNRTIRIDQKEISTESVDVKDSKIDSIQLIAGSSDTLAVYYSVTHNDYSDGELRKLPVYRRGTQESTGEFIPLTNDTTVTLTFDPSLGDIKVHAQADLLDALLEEIAFLKNYPYECNEQLASRLRALLLEKKIQAFKNERFKEEREVLKVIRKLVGHQKEDGSWGWWHNDDGSVWATLHVAGALDKAEEAGFPVAVDKQSLINYLVLNLANLASKHRFEAQAYLLNQGEKLQIQRLADSVRRSPKVSLHHKLLGEQLAQLTGQTPDWSWINARKAKTVKGNPYWGEERLDLFDNAVMNTIVVYRMIEKENPSSDELTKITNYFLEKRKRHWRNTYESSLILETILPRLLREKQRSTKPVLNLSGLDDETIEHFPFETTLSGASPLTVSKSGEFPIYFTAWQERWNPAPSRVEGDFVVSTSFENATGELTAGKPVDLIVEVEVKEDAEYVMIEVPIPAGCSYASKPRSRANGEVHREYYHHKTNIYCEVLKKGTYSYTIPLLPGYSGAYTLNPAVAECMYFPVINGREEVKRVSINPSYPSP